MGLETGRCRDCRFWDEWDDIFDVPTRGTCTRIIASQPTPDDEDPPDPDMREAHLTINAAMSTGADFGCTLWEQKA